MAAVRALVASRLAAASAFASLSPGGRTPPQRAALHLSVPRPAARVALVLSGCGVYDGTEIHEASAILVHLSRGGAEVQIFAPDVPQMHVIDHTKGQPSEGESRNVLTESARIARGKITDLANLSAANHDAAIFPGGFGAAKNLSTFAVDGKDCKVNKEVERVLKEFHQAGKPVGHSLKDLPGHRPGRPLRRSHRKRCRLRAPEGGPCCSRVTAGVKISPAVSTSGSHPCQRNVPRMSAQREEAVALSFVTDSKSR
ncbi:glutamine amidotransferase-like class 1 domain-containing protein 3A, mitochondrial isoform X3 [Nomascus leucogenys]|uniref:glutamine amidotransferase-like class 1 domain-containing protein 3A, mitochondrial isoform X3 n=1 Tax=Nomascus leucogenys TaxID=61853 RepID=UPI00122DA661|nr:glutamine amidotransferase-like class 1 domain-containing protein 3A, mitochondrial isoform X3 [Nomascus leucogenys]